MHVARPFVRSFPLWTALALAAAPLRADTLVTKDGRVIEVKKAREEGAGYRLWFEAGEITVPKEHVASVEIEGDMADYVPKDEKEKQVLAQGYVRHKGKWISKPQYETELAKANEARRKRTQELAARSKFANGWELETKHFKFKSNTSPEILKRYADLLEAYYDLMDSRIGIKPTPTLARTKLPVNVFRQQSEMIDDANEGKDPDDEDGGIDESILGYFSPARLTLNFFHDYKDPARSELTALHECTHLLTFLIDPDYVPQIWINEAVADYYGASKVSTNKGKYVLEPGQLEEDSILTVQQAIADKKHVPLATLFSQGHEQYDGFHYAHGWAFVYFLHNTPKYSKPFTKFFRDLYGLDLKEATAEIINTGFGDKTGIARRYSAQQIQDALIKRLGVKDVATLEKEWLAFIAATPIEGARARFLRGYSNAFDPDKSEAALADLEAAITAGHKPPEAFWARGYARAMKDGLAAAVEDFRQAVQLAPLEPRYRADLGWCLTGWWGEGEEVPNPDEEMRAQAKLEFGIATALDPENEFLRELFDTYVAALK
jgi:hypothetical protein